MIRVQTESQELQPWIAYAAPALLTCVDHDFSLRDSFCLSAFSLSWQRHDILDFSYSSLSRVLHVTLANLQKFGSF